MSSRALLIVAPYYLVIPRAYEYMSIVRQQVPPVENEHETETTPHVLDASTVQEVATDDTAANAGVYNVTLHGVYTPEELMDGVRFNLSDYAVGAIPEGRVIVSELATTAIGSHVGSNLMLSCNIFNTGSKKHYLSSGVNNSKGWATVHHQDELVPRGSIPIVSIMPNEYNRSRVVHYEPSSGVDDSLVKRYGHLSAGDNLRKGVVAFPGEDYYFVAKDHVVLDIIEKNWDTLGQSVPDERVREGNWIKVSTDLVNKVLDELDSSVLQNMPLTDLSKLRFTLKADSELAEQLDSSKMHPVSVTVSMAYRPVHTSSSA